MGNAGENASAAFNGPAPSPAEAPSLANKDEKADVRLRRFQPELDMIESMAEALAANADRKLPMDYFRNEARRRLATLKDPYARALLLGFERHRKPSGAKVCSDESFCRVAAGHAQCSDEGK
jgi:hypothetical protein